MRVLILYILTFNSFISFSQNFNGNYKSYETSFISNTNSETNFTENSEFNIFVGIINNQGYIICQDPRIPNKLLIFNISSSPIELENKYIFKNCANDYLADNSSSDIIFYYDDNGNLNLMISNNKSSQVFKDLVKD